MKYILVTILLFLCMLAQAQTKRLVEISREYFTQDIPVTDGMVYKYKIPSDTARYFAPGPDVYDVTVTFKKRGGVVIPPSTIMAVVDDASTNLTYSPGWTKATNQSWTANYYLKTASYAVVRDQTVTFSFSGTGFEIWAERRANHGAFGVSIDSAPEVIVDTYSSSLASPVTPEKVFERLGLANTTHEVRIRLTGVKNPAAATAAISASDKSDISVSIDKVVFYKPSL